MKRIRLKGTEIETSALGFGSVSLTKHNDTADAVRVLETALDAGITHYDTARLYGFGQSEGILGKFLAGKRGRVTVATKFGLAPNTSLGKSKRLVNMARWAAHRSEFVMKMAKRVLSKPGGAAAAGLFEPAQAQASFETSLRELGTEYVDILLLHECTIEDACREDLIAYLEGEVKRGRVRAFGTATEFSKMGGDAARFPAAHRVMQFDSTVLTPNVLRLKNAEGRGIITHGAAGLGRRIADAAKAKREIAAKFRERLGADVTDASVCTGFLLRDAARSNREGIVLFTSTSGERVKGNAAALADARVTDDQQAAFAECARAVMSAGA